VFQITGFIHFVFPATYLLAISTELEKGFMFVNSSTGRVIGAVPINRAPAKALDAIFLIR
jgi:hypothetical protein